LSFPTRCPCEDQDRIVVTNHSLMLATAWTRPHSGVILVRWRTRSLCSLTGAAPYPRCDQNACREPDLRTSPTKRARRAPRDPDRGRPRYGGAVGAVSLSPRVPTVSSADRCRCRSCLFGTASGLADRRNIHAREGCGGLRACGGVVSRSGYVRHATRCAPGLQGVGIGRICMQWIEGNAKRDGLRSVRFDASAAHEALLRFYRGQGYEERARFWFRGTHLVCFEKILTPAG